jgi:hypothetical protein
MKTSSGASVRQHLNRFAVATILAVGLLAVGLLAVAWPAEAQIVYTPVNITITQGSYKLELNNGGVTDFTIAVHSGSRKTQQCGIASHYVVEETPSSDNGAESSPPAELVTGDQIGPSQTFYAGRGILLSDHRSSCKSYSKGNWVIGEPGYLGLMFQISGQTYYGWASLTVGAGSATLTGYAYESTPGMPINAGQTK